MNTLIPVLEKFRNVCVSKLKARGWLRSQPPRPREFQMEFPWR